jgi:hypothetical protein
MLDFDGVEVSQDSSGLLRERTGRNAIKHGFDDALVVLRQVRTELLDSCQNTCEIGFDHHSRIIEFGHNHNDEIRIGKEIRLIEGVLWLVDLSEDLEEPIDFIRDLDIDKIENFP